MDFVLFTGILLLGLMFSVLYVKYGNAVLFGIASGVLLLSSGGYLIVDGYMQPDRLVNETVSNAYLNMTMVLNDTGSLNLTFTEAPVLVNATTLYSYSGVNVHDAFTNGIGVILVLIGLSLALGSAAEWKAR